MLLLPGFYGARLDGVVKTFSRGGSDVTGSIVAKAVKADVYENWTDVSGFLIADQELSIIQKELIQLLIANCENFLIWDFGHEEWEPFAPGLKTLEQAVEIRRRILTAFEEAERQGDISKRKKMSYLCGCWRRSHRSRACRSNRGNEQVRPFK